MNDKLLMDNYLLVLKSTVEVFVHGTLESSNEATRKLLKNGLDEIMNSQANTYKEMTEYNWYKIKNVKSSEIEKTLTSINQNN